MCVFWDAETESGDILNWSARFFFLWACHIKVILAYVHLFYEKFDSPRFMGFEKLSNENQRATWSLKIGLTSFQGQIKVTLA